MGPNSLSVVPFQTWTIQSEKMSRIFLKILAPSKFWGDLAGGQSAKLTKFSQIYFGWWSKHSKMRIAFVIFELQELLVNVSNNRILSS